MVLASACVAGSGPDFEGTGASGAGDGGTTSMGGSDGGTTTSSPCAQDCSSIVTAQCLVAVCNTGEHPGPVGSCVVVDDETGTPCDDGMFCTVNDACDAGVCVGGPQNDCGLSVPECNDIVCNESTQSCSMQAADNGAPCSPADLCVIGATCQNGLCGGGVPNDCFFQPVPNECHNSVCNPQTGMCEPMPGNDGIACVDQNDLCSVGNTCAGGVCGGGTPKDCSALTMGCFDGVCDTATGLCTQMAIMPGQQCAEATDECNNGICDVNGNCNPQPTNEGGACDTDGCFVGQTCAGGVCQGGTQITQCIDNDDCCPASCDLTNDDDCGCNFALISNEAQLNDPVIHNLITANGHTYVNYDNNASGTHTSNSALLNMYETVIFHEHDRTITTAEMNALIAWINAGGRLLVTGYDSLGSPTDANLAAVLNCTGPGDGPFSSALTVTNVSHPIMLGPAQTFTLNQPLTAGTTDHDTCTPGPNALKLVDVSGVPKLMVTDNVGAGNGKVIYWNGNGSTTGPVVDWIGTAGTQPALQNLFVNVLDHMCQ